MEEVYNINRYTYAIVIHIQKTKVCFAYCRTTEKCFTLSNKLKEYHSCIIYDKQEMNIKSWGKEHFESDEKNEDKDAVRIRDKIHRLFKKSKKKVNRDKHVRIDNFREELYRVFKKDKKNWNEDDLFLLKAVSDFIRLTVEDLIKTSKGERKSTDQFHYLFVVPSEWEKEIRETLLRPIFIQSKLISKEDHNDRLLFCSDLESIFYLLMGQKIFDFERRRKIISCRFLPISENEILMKLDLASAVNQLFDFPDSLLYPKVERSNQLSLTIDTFTDGIKAFIKDELPLDIQEEIIQIIMDKEYVEYKGHRIHEVIDKNYYKVNEEYSNEAYLEDTYKIYKEDEYIIREEAVQEECTEYEKKIYNEDKYDDAYYLEKPLITDTSKWKLDKREIDFIRRICISNICSQICKNTTNEATNNIDVLLSNDTVKEYSLLSRVDIFSSEIRPNKNLLNWSRYLLAYNRTSSRNKNITYTYYLSSRKFTPRNITQGAFRYNKDVIKNSNLYSRPYILPVKDLYNSSSIFGGTKIEAIMNIDISSESTILSLLLLDKNGFVNEIWNHNDFLEDESLCSLGSFFSFSETTTLNVKSSFIKFVEDRIIRKGFLFSYEENSALEVFGATKAETILCKDSYTEDLLVSTQQQIHIKPFLQLYIIYIKSVIFSKLFGDLYMPIFIGYNITVEKILLDRLFGTKDDLKDIIHASNLIRKGDPSKRLRIVTPGERIMHLLRQSFALLFPLKSYFVLAQLHENYIQLTLNQVVTEFGSSDEVQEAIIIHDKIIHIPNVYTSLCLNMWKNIAENNSLIKLCHVHQEYNSNDLLEIFSLKNQAEFAENLKQYLSKGNLGNNSNQPTTDKIVIQLSVSCNCRVYLTVCDIIEISFQPVLKEIVSLVSASFINKELFGKFWNIRYLFQLIQFDYNSQLHDSVIKMLEEITEDVMVEKGVDIPHYVIPRSLNRLLQPVLHRQHISYKEFQIGTLHLVHRENYGFSLNETTTPLLLTFNSKIKYMKIFSHLPKTTFLLFKEREIINDSPANFTSYLGLLKIKDKVDLFTKYIYDFEDEDMQKVIDGPHFCIRLNDNYMDQLPFITSVLYEAYSGSLILSTRFVGQSINRENSIAIGTSMCLLRI